MLRKIWYLFFPFPKLVIEPQHIPVTLNYQRRMSRCVPQVESHAAGPFPMKFVCDKPGRYISNGNRIVWTVSGLR
jgi:hypothetical protein